MLSLGRVLKGVLVGAAIIIIFSLLAGWTTIFPKWAADWLPLIWFLVGCITITLVGGVRLFRALITTLAIYLSAIILITLIDFLWADIAFGPFQLGSVSSVWAANQAQILTWIPQLQFLDELAVIISNIVSETFIRNILFNLVSYSFFAVLSMILAALASLTTRQAPVVSTMPPETSSSSPIRSPLGAAQTPPKMSMPPAQSREGKMPRTPAPSAKAIAELHGKPTKGLKSVDQTAPRGQSRCPHCNATVIIGSHFCNACQREF